MTGPVTTGSAEDGEIVTWPVPIEKRIVSRPGSAFAAMIASRRVQCAASHGPSIKSVGELTVNSVSSGTVTATHSENSEVLPSESVAVVATTSPPVTSCATVIDHDPPPEGSVVVVVDPRKNVPSPWPLPSHEADAKISIVYCSLGSDESVPDTVVSVPSLAARSMSGKFWRPLGPVSPSTGAARSFSVTPSSSRSMPSPRFSRISFSVTQFRVPPVMAMPVALEPLSAITLSGPIVFRDALMDTPAPRFPSAVAPSAPTPM